MTKYDDSYVSSQHQHAVEQCPVRYQESESFAKLRKGVKYFVVHCGTLLLAILPHRSTSDSLSYPLGEIKSQGNTTSAVVRKMFWLLLTI